MPSLPQYSFLAAVALALAPKAPSQSCEGTPTTGPESIPVQATVSGASQRIGAITLYVANEDGYDVCASFALDPSFANLDSSFDFDWVQVFEQYVVNPPSCGSYVFVSGCSPPPTLPSPPCGSLGFDCCVGPLPAIDPPSSAYPLQCGPLAPFDDLPFYGPSPSNLFFDTPEDPDNNTTLTFSTHLVARPSSPGPPSYSFCVLAGFRWSVTLPNATATVAYLGTVDSAAGAASINGALQSPSDTFPDPWTALSSCDLAPCALSLSTASIVLNCVTGPAATSVTLSNPSTFSPVSWTAGSPCSQVSVSPASGTLPPSSSTLVTVSASCPATACSSAACTVAFSGSGCTPASATLDVAMPLSTYGYATSGGCFGLPAIGATSAPLVGNPAFAVTCSTAPPNATGLFLLSLGPLCAPFVILDVSVWLDLSSALWLTTFSNGLGSAAVALAIPNSPAFVGAQVFGQYFWFDPCAIQGIAASNALGVVVYL